MDIVNKLQRLLLKRIHPQDSFTLKSRNIYILPTREGFIFALLILVMLAAAINFNNSLIFFFTFLMASVAVISMYMTQQNLLGLQFSIGHISPVFLFQPVFIPLNISTSRTRYSIAVSLHNNKDVPAVYTDVKQHEVSTVHLNSATHKRGYFKLKPMVISSRFPLGLFRAWANIELTQDSIVYPAPEEVHNFVPHQGGESEGSNPYGRGIEDFSGFKDYQQGEPLSHIHWKAYAKEQGLLSKTFSGSSHRDYWLNWSELSGHTEQKLSQLCRLIIDAEQNGDRYGLILPGKTINISTGQKHYHNCLKALALYS